MASIKKRRRLVAPVGRWLIRDYVRLRAYPGVVSVAIGAKETSHRPSRRHCVKIYVVEKSDAQARHAPLPKSAIVLVPSGKGRYRSRRLPTDVVAPGQLRLAANAGDFFEPTVPSGAKIGTGGVGVNGFGSLACTVRHQSTDELLLLTAGHVATSGDGAVPSEIQMFQPNSPVNKFKLGRTRDGFVGTHPRLGVHIDVALCARDDAARGSTNESWDIANLPRVRGHLTIEEVRQQRIPVHKVGAQTGHTVANFSAYHKEFTDPSLGTLFGVLEFVAETPAEAIADLGDSGAAVVSRVAASRDAMVGVLFALSSTGGAAAERIYVIPFETIREAFKVDVANV